MGVWCEITIRDSSEGVFKPGQAVTGLVKYAIETETEYQDIVLSLTGDGECSFTTTTTEHGSNNNARSATRKGTENYITRNVNVLMKRENQTVTLPIGAYEFPFEFILPSGIPSSCKNPKRMNARYKVCYRIKMKFIKANFFSINKTFEEEFIVYGNVNPVTVDGPIIYGLEKSLFQLFSSNDNRIRLKAEISKSYLSPGEVVHLKINVYNPTSVDITGVKAIVIRKTTLKSNCEHTNVTVNEIAESSLLISNVYNEGQPMVGNIAMMPEFYSIQHSRIINVEYLVKVVLMLPIPHLNASVEMPIVIGEGGSANTELDVRVLDDDLHLPPPSYFESMGEGSKHNKENM